jgi:hypothetical protein
MNPKDYDRNNELRKKIWNIYEQGRSVIAIDLDECMLDTCSVILSHVNKICGTDHKVEHIHQYDMAKTLNIDPKVFQEILHETDYLSNTPPFPFAKEFLNRLKSKDFNGLLDIPEQDVPYIVFITHRGFRPDGFILTHDLLIDHDLIPDMLIVCPIGMNKVEVMDELFDDNVKLAIEDQPKILHDFLEAGIPVMKNLRPWNISSVWTDFSIDLKVSSLLIAER